MRRKMIHGFAILALLLGAGVAGAEMVRDTLMLQAKDSQAKLVAIDGLVYHVTPATKIVAVRRRTPNSGEAMMTLAEIQVPETKGAKVPAGELGILVKYEARVNGDYRELTSLLVYPKGSRPR